MDGSGCKHARKPCVRGEGGAAGRPGPVNARPPRQTRPPRRQLWFSVRLKREEASPSSSLAPGCPGVGAATPGPQPQARSRPGCGGSRAEAGAQDVSFMIKPLCKIHIYRIIKSVQTQVSQVVLGLEGWGSQGEEWGWVGAGWGKKKKQETLSKAIEIL